MKLVFKSDSAQARSVELCEGKNRLGRGAENDIRILDPSVSSFHCEITVGMSGVWVVDIGSTNGSFIDERPIQDELLRAGQILRLGEVRLVLESGSESGAPEPKVSIPPLSAAPLPVQRFLPDGSAVCLIHPEIVSGFKCEHCNFAFCEECVRAIGIAGGRTLFFCPECDGKCVPLELPQVPRSFSEHVKSFFGRIAAWFQSPYRK